jgi:hypothetical protein
MAGRFPKDCWSKNCCKHFHTWDMSVDDLCCRCTLLKVECDACDENFSFLLCPLPRYKQIMLRVLTKINFNLRLFIDGFIRRWK